jgi:aminoglycoside phosphotransferase (APT) family kinase protein
MEPLPPWSPEIEITEALAAQLIEVQFPELKPVSLKKIGEGFDNTVFHVNDVFLFRFPRRAVAVDLLQLEWRLLPVLRQLELPIEIPKPLFIGQSNDDFPWSFVGYAFIEGQSLGLLSDQQRLDSVRALAHFLLKLHRMPIEKAEQLGVPRDQWNRLDVPKRLQQLTENMNKVADLKLWSDWTVIHNVVFNLYHYIPEAYRETLVHGDLHIRNVLVNQSGQLAAIIDWGDAHIGHPALDLSMVYSYFPPEARKLFYSIYGEVSSKTRQLARFRAINTNLYLILYGYDRGDKLLVTAAQESLRLALQP